MNKLVKRIILALLVAASLFSALPASAVRVRSYHRKNGTYVSSHYRRPPRRSYGRRRRHYVVGMPAAGRLMIDLPSDRTER